MDSVLIIKVAVQMSFSNEGCERAPVLLFMLSLNCLIDCELHVNGSLRQFYLLEQGHYHSIQLQWQKKLILK